MRAKKTKTFTKIVIVCNRECENDHDGFSDEENALFLNLPLKTDTKVLHMCTSIKNSYNYFINSFMTQLN